MLIFLACCFAANLFIFIGERCVIIQVLNSSPVNFFINIFIFVECLLVICTLYNRMPFVPVHCYGLAQQKWNILIYFLDEEYLVGSGSTPNNAKMT